METLLKDLENLSNRWASAQVDSLVAELRRGKVPSSPFGSTDGGQIDLRGISVNEPVILSGGSLAGVDFSHARLSKLLCVKATISDCKFDNSEMVFLGNDSKVYRSSFNEARLATSGSTGMTEFNECSFNKTDLTGGMFKQGRFFACKFSEATLDRVEFGESVIEASEVAGSLSKCFFRGPIKQCDLTEATFLDCAFYGALFIDCRVSDHALVIESWPEVFASICGDLDSGALSLKTANALRKACAVWSKLTGVIMQNLIDRRDFEKSYGSQVAGELFAYLTDVKRRVGES